MATYALMKASQNSNAKENKIMYIFEATYENMDTFEERKATIEFDGQFLKSDQECYIYAMEQAYKDKRKNECLAKLEFVAC